MKVIARFINGKLAGWQYAKEEKITDTTDVYPFTKGDSSNEYAWAKRWATHGEDRVVEVIDANNWNPGLYVEYEPPKEETEIEKLTKRVEALEAKE